MAEQSKLGRIVWTDMSIPNADELRDFYAAVVGWKSKGFDMGGYDDHVMTSPDGEKDVAGICHNRGVNAGIPPGWLMYVTVESVDESVKQCEVLGGEVVHGPRTSNGKSFAVIRDPSGAHMAIIEP